MTRRIKTHYNNTISGKKDILYALSNEGLTITNEDPIEFKESYNFTDHTGKNRWKILSPLLKGRLSLDTENKILTWEININGILIASILLLVASSIIFGYYFEQSFTDTVIIVTVLVTLLLSINWIVLRSRIERITNILN